MILGKLLDLLKTFLCKLLGRYLPPSIKKRLRILFCFLFNWMKSLVYAKIEDNKRDLKVLAALSFILSCLFYKMGYFDLFIAFSCSFFVFVWIYNAVKQYVYVKFNLSVILNRVFLVAFYLSIGIYIANSLYDYRNISFELAMYKCAKEINEQLIFDSMVSSLYITLGSLLAWLFVFLLVPVTVWYLIKHGIVEASKNKLLMDAIEDTFLSPFKDIVSDKYSKSENIWKKKSNNKNKEI